MRRRPGGPADPTRRAWVRAVGAGAAGLALGCGDNLTDDAAAAAILEPADDSFLVSIWSSHGGRASVEVCTGDELVASFEVALGDGGTGAVALTGLAPGRLHEVHVTTAADRTLGPYRVRTAPRADDPRPVRIAVSADFDPAPSFDSALVDHVLAAQPDLFVSLGDFPYTDNGPPAQTVDEYRARHVALRTAPAVRRLFEGVGVRAIYDDHEFRNDWDAMFAAVEADRYGAAMQVWDEFFPVRDPIGEIRYRRWRWGAHAECFLLDVRRFRSPNSIADDANKHMLGATQLAWLIDGVTRSTATFKLVFTGVPLDFGGGGDHWAGFTHERDLLLAALVGIPGIVVLTADQHYFAAHRHAYGVREFQVGPLARGLGSYGRDAPGVVFRSQQLNAGLLEIDGDRLVVSGLGADGQRFYSEELTSELLTPR